MRLHKVQELQIQEKPKHLLNAICFWQWSVPDAAKEISTESMRKAVMEELIYKDSFFLTLLFSWCMPRRMASYALSKFTLSHHLNNISPVQQTPSLSLCTLLQASPVTRALAVCAPRIHGPALTPQLHNLCSECQKWAVSLHRDKKNKNYRYWCDRIVSSSRIQDGKHRCMEMCVILN